MSAKSAEVEAAHNGSGRTIGKATTEAILNGGPKPKGHSVLTRDRVLAFSGDPDAAVELRLGEERMYSVA